MKVVILAGGYGTRLSEETHVKPKTMVEIGDMPILWHIMKIYSHYGYNEFIICLGYKGNYIKEWFNNYYLHHSDMTIDLEKNKIEFHKSNGEKWKVTLVDTGDGTMTGGRLKRIKEYIGNNPFMMTYGDGVCDIRVDKLVEYHKSHKADATMTTVIPEGRFGTVVINRKNGITAFSEKTDNKNRVNGGFFVFEPVIFDYIEGDHTILEREPLETFAREGNINAYTHDGFWMPMDKLSDKIQLETMWKENRAPWKVWDKKSNGKKSGK
ncbi:MAG: glucose-1-phosphate cytidylyltransferase [Bacteroidota bacterium]|nr:glucose-1-phosphate cytidylyltransferase [Bacteroidota bacterium]